MLGASLPSDAESAKKHVDAIKNLADFGVTVGEVKLDIGVAAKRRKSRRPWRARHRLLV